jgi:hypothetical protein
MNIEAHWCRWGGLRRLDIADVVGAPQRHPVDERLSAPMTTRITAEYLARRALVGRIAARLSER